MKSENAILLIVTLGAGMWGLYWVPLHLLAHLGVTGAMGGTMASAGTLPFVLALTWFYRHQPIGIFAIWGSVLAGLGFGGWGVAVAFTDVIRAILLFYLLPVWSAAIEWGFLGKKLTWQTGLAICLSLLGILVICRGEVPLAGLGAIGDWLALAAGILFAAGMTLLFQDRQLNIPKIVLIVITSSFVACLMCVFLFQSWVEPMTFRPAQFGLALVIGLVFMLPLFLITMWGTTELSPTTMSFLMTAEVIVGVVSSAIFLDQPFGWPEAVGASLILAGVVVGVFGKPKDEVALAE